MALDLSKVEGMQVGRKIEISEKNPTILADLNKLSDLGSLIYVPVTFGEVLTPLSSDAGSIYEFYRRLEIPLKDEARRVIGQHASGNYEKRPLIVFNDVVYAPIEELTQALEREHRASGIRLLKRGYPEGFIKP
ncbi:hypothetical protein HYT53_00465 [Candidatus Woesearchaeota archaeon]|nr:hypothetical protein [Candidatus Woesearchaeota archaeon]